MDMANNYSESSFTVPFTPANAEAVKAWHKGYIVACAILSVERCGDEYDDKVPGLEVEVGDDKVWFSGDGEYFNVTAAIFWVQELLKAMDSDKGVFFSWADWCSKARVGEFGGGACVVIQNDCMMQYPSHLLRDAAEAGIEVGNV
jgi:hypothetical protein